MAVITASEINRLRQQTGAGMMDCKKALTESNGDFDKAIDYLRKKGQKVSALRADREAKEGVVVAIANADMSRGVILNLSSETDFVAKTEDFIDFAKKSAQLALEKNVSTVEEVNALQMDGITIADKLAEMVGKIGEKIEIRRFEKLEGQAVVPYVHSNYRLGVLVAFNQPKSDALTTTGKEIAMQVAAMNPAAVDKDSVSQDVIDRELDIARDKAKAEGKPESMIDKIAAGALNKFFNESTLLNQEFVKDPKKKISDVLKDLDKDLKVTAFRRITLSS
jgi:elongation factor Ts